MYQYKFLCKNTGIDNDQSINAESNNLLHKIMVGFHTFNRKK